jgi:hypothetical protein
MNTTPLSPEEEARILRVFELFKDVDPRPFAKWKENFQNDNRREHEIAFWERMARTMTSFLAERPELRRIGLDVKREVYGVLVSCALHFDDTEWSPNTLKHTVRWLKTNHLKRIQQLLKTENEDARTSQ